MAAHHTTVPGDVQKLRLSGYAAIAAAAVACRIPSFLQPMFDNDEGQYAAIAALARAGGRLYGDGGVDNKPPGIYWTYELVFAVFGRYAMWAVHLVALAAVAATACLLATFVRRIASPRAGWLAGLGYAVLSTVDHPKLLAANTEIFMTLAVTAAMVLATCEAAPRWLAAIAAGVLVAVACAFKQSAAPVAPVVALAAWQTTPRVPRVALVGVGLTAGAALIAAAVAATSSLDDMWLWTVTRLGAYGSSAWQGAVGHNVVAGLLPWVASTIAAWLFAVLAARRAREHYLMWLWLAASMISACASGQFFCHYFIQPLAPLVAIAAVELDRRWASRRARVAAGVLAGLPVAGFFALSLAFEPMTESIGAPSPDFREAVAWIDANTAADARIFVWGDWAPFYVLADRLPATRFVGFMRGAERDRGAATSWDVGPEVWRLLADDFIAHPPALIVDTSTGDYMSFAGYPLTRFPEVATLASGYAAVGVVGGVTWYVPRDPPTRARRRAASRARPRRW